METYKYIETPPASHLKNFIETYWVLETGALYQPSERRIYPDGCTEIFINMGNMNPLLNDKPLLPGNIYLGGTMTSSSIIHNIPNSLFMGIRFKPGGFSVFYKMSLQETTDEIIEFSDRLLYSLFDSDKKVTDRLDHFFTGKIRATRNLLAIAETVEVYKGKITVDHLAKMHFVTNRTLERMFNEHMGIPPKEFIKVIRFQQVLKRIRKNEPTKNLSNLAYEMGYYDQAHLTNDVKRYSGLSPKELVSMFIQ
ncbi:AraC-like DNA-binding protein [Pedobacter sp. UYP24]